MGEQAGRAGSARGVRRDRATAPRGLGWPGAAALEYPGPVKISSSAVFSSALCAVAALAGCDSEAGFPDARPVDAAPVPGTFSLSWTVTDTTDSQPVTCDDANAQSLSITVREAGSSTGQVELFNCASSSATSRPYPPGTYVLGFELRGSAGEVATAPSRNDVVVVSGQDTPIGALDFAVAAAGAFDLTVTAAAATDTNCGPFGTAGGGIDQIELTLEKDGACVPFDYTIAAGPTVTTACPATPVACIERTDVIAAAELGSGRYQIGAIGRIGGAACWTGSREFRVPTGGGRATTTLALAYQAAVPGCPPVP